jgi:hypothetical protein
MPSHHQPDATQNVVRPLPIRFFFLNIFSHRWQLADRTARKLPLPTSLFRPSQCSGGSYFGETDCVGAVENRPPKPANHTDEHP